MPVLPEHKVLLQGTQSIEMLVLPEHRKSSIARNAVYCNAGVARTQRKFYCKEHSLLQCWCCKNTQKGLLQETQSIAITALPEHRESSIARNAVYCNTGVARTQKKLYRKRQSIAVLVLLTGWEHLEYWQRTVCCCNTSVGRRVWWLEALTGQSVVTPV